MPRSSSGRLAAIARSPAICARISQRLRPGDYFAMLAYLAVSQAHTDVLQAMRLTVRDRTRVATCLEYGPQFLHSTGQAYKGGPNTGLFLQITCDDATDLPVPGRKLSFGAAKAAAARGRLRSARERGPSRAPRPSRRRRRGRTGRSPVHARRRRGGLTRDRQQCGWSLPMSTAHFLRRTRS